MKILIIEDDENILAVLKRGFEEENYIIDSASNGEDGEYLALTNSYDLILLDWMLPLKSGIEVLENLRQQSILTPVIMLTAKDDIDDKVLGLTYGADEGNEITGSFINNGATTFGTFNIEDTSHKANGAYKASLIEKTDANQIQGPPIGP